jgi:hypothetical protein
MERHPETGRLESEVPRDPAPRGRRVGLTLLAIAMTGAIVLVTDVIYSSVTTLVAGLLVGALFAVLWYAVPIRRRVRLGR